MDKLPPIVDEATRQQFQLMFDELRADLEASAQAHINASIDAVRNQRRVEREQEYAAIRQEIAGRATITTVEKLVLAQAAQWRISTANMIDRALDFKLNPFMLQLTQMSRDIATLSGAVNTRLSDRDDGLQRAERRIENVAGQTETRFQRLDNLITEVQSKAASLENRHLSLYADIYGDVMAKDGQPSMMGTLRELLGEMKALNQRIETIERETEQRRMLVQRFVGAAKSAPRWVQIGVGLLSGGGLLAILIDWLNQLAKH